MKCSLFACFFSRNRTWFGVFSFIWAAKVRNYFLMFRTKIKNIFFVLFCRYYFYIISDEQLAFNRSGDCLHLFLQRRVNVMKTSIRDKVAVFGKNRSIFRHGRNFACYTFFRFPVDNWIRPLQIFYQMIFSGSWSYILDDFKYV
mgnify:FL=1